LKIYRFENGIIFVGKAWEIRAKLKEYSREYTTVHEWIKDDKLARHSITIQKKL
jgi:Mother cell inhibitor of FtsZ